MKKRKTNKKKKNQTTTVLMRGVLLVAEKQPTENAFFSSIFLNVNCERGEVKRGRRRSLQLSESRPQSYCSLAINDAKHSLKPIYTYSYNPRGIKLATPPPNPPTPQPLRVFGHACVVTVFVSACCATKGYKRTCWGKKKKTI